jgi:hypothetical protein
VHDLFRLGARIPEDFVCGVWTIDLLGTRNPRACVAHSGLHAEARQHPAINTSRLRGSDLQSSSRKPPIDLFEVRYLLPLARGFSWKAGAFRQHAATLVTIALTLGNEAAMELDSEPQMTAAGLPSARQQAVPRPTTMNVHGAVNVPAFIPSQSAHQYGESTAPFARRSHSDTEAVPHTANSWYAAFHSAQEYTFWHRNHARQVSRHSARAALSHELNRRSWRDPLPRSAKRAERDVDAGMCRRERLGSDIQNETGRTFRWNFAAPARGPAFAPGYPPIHVSSDEVRRAAHVGHQFANPCPQAFRCTD